MENFLDNVWFFRLARRASKESDYRFKVGAVLISRSGRPISFGWNKNKTHPIFANPCKTMRRTLHAEMDCIKNIPAHDLKDATLYIYREDLLGKIAMARPCEDCMENLKARGISVVFYSVRGNPFFRREEI